LGVTGFSINKNISDRDFDFECPSFVVLQRVQSEKSCIPLLPPLIHDIPNEVRDLVFLKYKVKIQLCWEERHIINEELIIE